MGNRRALGRHVDTHECKTAKRPCDWPLSLSSLHVAATGNWYDRSVILIGCEEGARSQPLQ